MLRRLIPLVVAVAAVAVLVVAPSSAAPTELFLSEYIEGSSNNKALEIFNGTGAPVNLATGGYNVQMHFNGNPVATLTINLTGTVAAGDVYVLAHSSASATIQARADQTNGSGWFNGDDAVVLRKGTTVIDVIGQIGFDPGTEWGSGLTSTADNTLRRNAAIEAGDADGTNAFDPAAEWDGSAVDTFGGLGWHGDAPGVDFTTPNAGATAVPLNANVSITFSEPVNVSGAWFSISCTTSGAHPAAESGGPTTFTLNPTLNFAGNETCLVTIVGAQVTDQDANDPPDAVFGNYVFSFTTAAPPPPPSLIREIQGAAHTSPKVDQVVNTSGIVTAVSGSGFWMQDPAPDADPATSEGILVFTGSAPGVAVGDAVEVVGRVTEFIPGGASTGNLSTTEITSPSIDVTSSLNLLPAATVIGTGGRVPPGEIIDDDGFAAFDPAQDGIDFYESLEGMRVQVDDAVAVGPTNDFGEIAVVGDGGANAGVRTPRGGVIISATDFNPERIIFDDVLLPVDSMPLVDVGDGLGSVVGVLDYSFGSFKVLPGTAPTVTARDLARETTTASGPGELSIATFNVENLDPGDPQEKFDALAALIVENLGAPDLVSLEEMQDDTGPTNDGVVAAGATFAKLIAAIDAIGPTYDFRQIDPVNNQDGGEPGGNIRVGFLFRTDRGLAFVDRPGGGSTTATTVNTGAAGPELSASPGRVDPTNAAFNNSRKPLAGEFTFRGATLFVIANHFNSKGGDQPLFGASQPPTRPSEVQRHQQAQVVNDFVDLILGVDSTANVVVLGDLNDFDFSETLSIVQGGVLSNLYETLPQAERYSYVFEGNSQALDHILLSTNAAAGDAALDVVHVNAEFEDGASDHDPLVATICAEAIPPTLSAVANPNRLFPPNHKYVTVNVTITAADGSGAPEVDFVSATSSEPDDAPGDDDGITLDDIVQVDDDTFKLRAERNQFGPGRLYTLTYRATDACGNSTLASATVRVPIGGGD